MSGEYCQLSVEQSFGRHATQRRETRERKTSMISTATTLIRPFGVALATLGIAAATLLASPDTTRGSESLAPTPSDLRPTMCTTAPARMGARELRCLVENSSVGDAPATETAFTFVNVNGQRSHVFLPTPALKAGESALLSVFIVAGSPFRVVADARNVALESNENNNTVSCGDGVTDSACPLPEI
jgi:hypothetical protein